MSHFSNVALQQAVDSLNNLNLAGMVKLQGILETHIKKAMLEEEKINSAAVQDAKTKIFEIAKSVNMTPLEIMSVRIVTPKYRHPVSNETWSGMGRKPNWVKNWLAAGRILADIEITA
jgi:DNA-binding protein H-NS